MNTPLLCRLGWHFYGPWTLTRFNPSQDLFTVHSHCRCGMNKVQHVPGKLVPDDASHDDLRGIAAARAKKEQ